MGRHFSESEVSAMSRNKIEDKGLKERLFRLHEEKTITYDNYSKEKKRVLDLLKENQRTSGNIQVEFDEKDIPEDTFKHVLLSRRPWSCTTSETTFNVVYREASDPGLLKATYRIKEKGTKRRASAKSVPNGSRSLSVSRQSTRSEPITLNKLQRSKSTLSYKSSQIVQNNGNRNHARSRAKDDILCEFQPAIRKHVTCVIEAWTDEHDSPSHAQTVNHVSIIKTTTTHGQELLEYVNNDGQLSGPEVLESGDIELQNSGQEVLKSGDDDGQTNGQEVLEAEGKEDKTSGLCEILESEGKEDKTSRQDVLEPRDNETHTDEIATLEKTEGKTVHYPIRAKSKIRKKLSIQEPNLNEITEENVAEIQIFELGKSNRKQTSQHDKFSVAKLNLNDGKILKDDRFKEKTEPMTTNDQSDTVLEENQEDNKNSVSIEHETIKSSTDEIHDNKHLLERQTSRPSTVALVETIDVVDFNSLQNENDGNYIIYKGKIIHNYVKPQLRYKHDPFSLKSRESLIRKLTTDIPVIFKEEKANSARLHRVYSKGTRARMLKQLIEENNSQKKGRSFSAENDKLDEKIREFYSSLSDFCRPNSSR